MESKKAIIMLLYVIGILLGLVAILMTYTGLPGDMDTEPILGFGIFFVAIAGLLSIK
jgi:hypothetical protein